MKAEMNAEYDGDLGARVEDVAQEAIDAVAKTYGNDAAIDVGQHLREQLSSRGITGADDAWITEVTEGIRADRPVQVGESDGSVGYGATAPPAEG